MAERLRSKLTAAVFRQVSKPGYYSNVGGLVLQVRLALAKSWLYHYRAYGGRLVELGLGAAAVIPLQDAQRMAAEASRMRAHGMDSLAAKRARQAALRDEKQARRTFAEVATDFLSANRGVRRNAKHAKQWSSTLRAYVSTIFGSLRVAEVRTAHVMAVLQPIWQSKHETASRLRQKVARVLTFASTLGFRQGENPAPWEGHLDQLLPSSRAIRRFLPITHHVAPAVTDVSPLVRELSKRPGAAALGSRFLLLTAARTGEVTNATWGEIDIEKRVWTVPAARMKGGREHRVPLILAGIDVLDAARENKVCRPADPVFIGPNGRALSNGAFLSLLERTGRDDFTPHGFRSSFRVWAAEQTQYPRELAEATLSHVVGSDTETAYQRGNFFARRARLMADWSDFVSGTAVAARSVDAPTLRLAQ